MNPPEARELLALYFQVKGLPEDDADTFVDHIAKDKEQFLRAIAAERLSTSEEGLRKPIVSASSAALSTAVGAFIPVIPFFFLRDTRPSSSLPSSRSPLTSPSEPPSPSSPFAHGGPADSR